MAGKITKKVVLNTVLLSGSDLVDVLREAGYDIPDDPIHLSLWGTNADGLCNSCEQEEDEMLLTRIFLKWHVLPKETKGV